MIGTIRARALHYFSAIFRARVSSLRKQVPSKVTFTLGDTRSQVHALSFRREAIMTARDHLRR